MGGRRRGRRAEEIGSGIFCWPAPAFWNEAQGRPVLSSKRDNSIGRRRAPLYVDNADGRYLKVDRENNPVPADPPPERSSPLELHHVSVERIDAHRVDGRQKPCAVSGRNALEISFGAVAENDGPLHGGICLP